MRRPVCWPKILTHSFSSATPRSRIVIHIHFTIPLPGHCDLHSKASIWTIASSWIAPATSHDGHSGWFREIDEFSQRYLGAHSACPPGIPRLNLSAIVWTTLITNTKYLSGLLTLDHSLKVHGSKYPLVALYTDTFPEEGHRALDLRKIPKQRVAYLLPSVEKDFSQDPRFYDCWSKLTPFSLIEYDRVVQLDSDMLVLKNMDELMDLELDAPSMEGLGKRVFAASHACLCNPLKKPHYPEDWSARCSNLKRSPSNPISGFHQIAHSPLNTLIHLSHNRKALFPRPVSGS